MRLVDTTARRGTPRSSRWAGAQRGHPRLDAVFQITMILHPPNVVARGRLGWCLLASLMAAPAATMIELDTVLACQAAAAAVLPAIAGCGADVDE